MSSHISVRDYLYEEPGPKTRRAIRIGTAVSVAALVALLGLIVRQFYRAGQLDPRYWVFFTRWTTWRFILEGFVGTVQVALTAGAIAIVCGLGLMLLRISHNMIASTVARIIIEFFRGVPSLLLIYFFFLVIPQYNIKLSAFWMITIPVSLAAAGVLAEVFRAGMNAVPTGQTEAALALGMRPFRITMKIVFPQALKMVIPSLISQLVVVVKDTTVAYVVSFPDMLQNARVLIANYDALVSTYFIVAIIYILVNFGVNQLAIYVSHRSGAKIVTQTNIEPV